MRRVRAQPSRAVDLALIHFTEVFGELLRKKAEEIAVQREEAGPLNEELVELAYKRLVEHRTGPEHQRPPYDWKGISRKSKYRIHRLRDVNCLVLLRIGPAGIRCFCPHRWEWTHRQRFQRGIYASLVGPATPPCYQFTLNTISPLAYSAFSWIAWTTPSSWQISFASCWRPSWRGRPRA